VAKRSLSREFSSRRFSSVRGCCRTRVSPICHRSVAGPPGRMDVRGENSAGRPLDSDTPGRLAEGASRLPDRQSRPSQRSRASDTSMPADHPPPSSAFNRSPVALSAECLMASECQHVLGRPLPRVVSPRSVWSPSDALTVVPGWCGGHWSWCSGCWFGAVLLSRVV
jgi:hypothetical protein